MENLIRINDNPADGSFKLVYEKNTMKVLSEKNNEVWRKSFENEIKIIECLPGNFGTIMELIKITLSNDEILLYTTNGEYVVYFEGEKFNDVGEIFKARTLYYSDLPTGDYKVSANVSDFTDPYELFDGLGSCVYRGADSMVHFKISIDKYDVLQIKTRDCISITNITVEKIEHEKKIYVIGDSTLTNQTLPFWGWPQLLQAKTGYIVKNFAISARSTKSFMWEGRFRYVLDCVNPEDIIIIGFGHNDEKLNMFGSTPSEYVEQIKLMKEQFEKIGARVLVTSPIARRNFVNDKLIDTHGDYLIKLHEQIGIKIDTNSYSKELIEKAGVQNSKRLFVHSKELKIVDNTHTSFEGAEKICDEVVKNIKF